MRAWFAGNIYVSFLWNMQGNYCIFPVVVHSFLMLSIEKKKKKFVRLGVFEVCFIFTFVLPNTSRTVMQRTGYITVVSFLNSNPYTFHDRFFGYHLCIGFLLITQHRQFQKKLRRYFGTYSN